MTYQVVIPGERVGNLRDGKPGSNTYVEGEEIFALRMGILRTGRGHVDVVGVGGRYVPLPGDMVIGTVLELGPSNWYLDVGAALDVGMHVNEVPWRVEFGETAKYLAVGESVILKVYHVDELRKPQVSMKDRACRKLEGGFVLDVAPHKIPRLIGRQGSMMDQLRDHTECRLFVGRNGKVWVDGEPDRVSVLIDAIRMIEREAHIPGLTGRVHAFLEERLGPAPSHGTSQKGAGESGEGHDEEE